MLRRIGSALPEGYEIGARIRPAMAQIWEWLWRLTGQGSLLRPKPAGLTKEMVREFAPFGYDTGLRWIKGTPLNKFWQGLVHSDIDLQFIFKSGAPETVKKAADKFFEDLNKSIGIKLFQHGDAFTGILTNAKGATLQAFDKMAVLINQSGFAGMGKGTGWLGSPTFTALLEQIEWSLKRAAGGG